MLELIDLRNYLTILTIGFLIALSVICWFRAFKKSITTPQKWFNVAYGILMGCFGVMRLATHLRENILSGLDPVLLWKFGILAGFVGLISIVFVMERYSLKTNYQLTIIESIGLLLVMLFPVSIGELGYDASLITYLIFPIGAFAVLGIFLNLLIKTSGRIRLKLLAGFLGILLIFVGFFIGTDLVQISLEYSIFENLLMICGAVLLSISKYELTWAHTLKYLYIVNKEALPIFQFDFTTSKDSVDSGLLAKGITGMVGLLREITQSQKYIEVIDQSDTKILLKYGKNITAILFSSDNLKILHDQLYKLVNDVENLYGDVFRTLEPEAWADNLEIFQPIKKIFEGIFQSY